MLKETSLIWRVLLQENTETGSTGYGNPGTDGADGKGPITDGMKDTTRTDKGGEDTLDAVPFKVTEITEQTVHSAADFLIVYATPEGITSMSCCQLLATCNLCYS